MPVQAGSAAPRPAPEPQAVRAPSLFLVFLACLADDVDIEANVSGRDDPPIQISLQNCSASSIN
jgi:hypothetical protein